MRLSWAIAAIALLVAACVAGGRGARPSAAAEPCSSAPPPTYEADVRPVLERRCFACHANDGPAADEHDFTRIETLRAQRRQLVDEVTARAMPPKGRPQLTDAEARTLLQWVACGATER